MNEQTTNVALEGAKQWLAEVEIGEPSHHRNLTVFPLFPRGEGASAAKEGRSRYTMLSDAIAAGTAAVEEVSEGGQVPFLTVKNSGAKPILTPVLRFSHQAW